MNLSLPVWRLFERMINHPMLEHLAELRQQQWLKFPEIEQIQQERLSRLVAVAYGPDRAGAALASLPMTTKGELNRRFVDYRPRRSDFVAASSGSTGKNTRVWCNNPTAARYRACFMLALEWSGWQMGEPHVQTGMNVGRGWMRRIKDWWLHTHYVSCLDLTPAHAKRTLELIESQSIQHLWGYPGALYVLAQQAELMGWNRPLRGIVTWGDSLYDHYRGKIESVFRTSVYNTYGIGEGIQVAAQCGEGNHYHIHALDTIVESVDDDGHPVPPGSMGHALLTRFDPGPMPLVRYRVGDMVTLIEGTCKCGRELPLLAKVDGRDTDIIRTPSGRALIVHFFTGLFEHYPFVDSFLVRQSVLERLDIQVVLTPAEDGKQAVEAIRSDLVARGLTDLELNIDIVDQIPTAPSGKRRFVISEIS